MKMKRLIYSVLALAAMAFAFPSCNDDAPEEVQITFMASLEQNPYSRTSTSGLSEGGMINAVKCEVYEEVDGQQILRTQDIVTYSEGSAIYTPTLLRGRTYTALFFAYTASEESPEQDSYNVESLLEVTRNKNLCNDESMDAFAAKKTITTAGTIDDNGTNLGYTISLTRPLAQLNFATTDDDIFGALQMLSTKGWEKEKLEDLNMELYETRIKIESMSTSYNVWTGEVNENQTQNNVVLTQKPLPSDEGNPVSITANSTSYHLIATAYLFPGETTNCYLTVYAKKKDDASAEPVIVNKSEDALKYESVPLKKNIRTNVIGSLMTGNKPYQIVLSTDFYDDDENIDVNASTSGGTGTGNENNN